MPSRMRYGFLMSLVVISLVVISFNISHAETINYFYDDLHRLIRVEFGSGVAIQYTYDQYGNRTQEVIRDIAAPTTTASPPGGAYSSAQSVALNCSDGYGVGCDNVYYTIDGSTPTTSSPVYLSPINISATTTLKFFAKDLAGNTEAVKTQAYTIDTSPLTGTITINGGAASTNSVSATLTLSCTDSQGCSQMQFSNDNTTYSTPEAYSTSKSWTLTSGDGTKTVYAKFKDTQNNWSTAYSDTILLDTTLPTNSTGCTETHGAPNNTWQSSVSDPAFTWSGASDAGSGIKGYYWYFGTSSSADPTNWTTTAGCDPAAVSPGTYYLRAKTEDNSGNRSSPATLFTFIYGTGGGGAACASGSYSDPTAWTNKIIASGNTISFSSYNGYSGTITVLGATVSGGLDASGYPVGEWPSDWIVLITATGNTIQLLSYGGHTGTITVSGASVSGGIDARPTSGITDAVGEGSRIRLESVGTGYITFTPGCAAPDTTPPTTTANPAGGTYNSAQSVTLTCNDGTGSGCDKIYYTTNGTTPTTSSPVYSSPINISATTTLKFFAKDLAGNSEAVKTQTYTMDITLPTGTININSGAASTNNINVTLTLSCSDTNGCSQMQFSNDNVTYSAAQAYAATKTWTLTTGDGTKTVYVKFKDTPGNWSTAYSDTILLDTTLPTGTNTINSGAAFTKTTSVTLTLTCSDTNGCSQMQFSNDNVTYSAAQAYAATKTWTLTTGDATKTVYAKFKDTPGNWSTPYSDTIVLDATAPTTTASPAGGTYASAQSVTLTCNDGTGSGCDKIYYTTNGTTPTTSSPVYSSPISITATTTLKFFATDLAANSEAVKTQTYTMDTTLPTGSINTNSGAASTTSTNVTLTLSCSDTNGCSQMQFSNDNMTYSTPEAYATSKAWVLSTGDGTKTVYVKFKDTPGNWSTAYSDTILLDTTLPTGTNTINSGAAFTKTTSVTLTLSCSDTNACSQMQFSNDNVTYSAAQAYAATKTWTLTTGDGTKTVYVKFKDVPGNWSTPYNDTILLDTIAPTTTASPQGGTYTSAQSVALTCTDGTGSGCDKIYYTTNGTTPTTSSPVYSSPINISATTTLKFFATDLATNSESVKTQTYTIVSGGAVCASGSYSDPSGWTNRITASGNSIYVSSYAGPSGTIILSGATASGGLDASGYPCGEWPSDWIHYIMASGNTIQMFSYCGRAGAITLSGVTASGGVNAMNGGGFMDIVGEGSNIRLESSVGTGFITLSPGCN